MRIWVNGIGLIALMCCTSVPAAESEASGAAASKVVASTPEEDFVAADKADKDDDMITAGKMYRRAADAGHAEAQARLGHILYRAASNTLALEYFRKSADQGNAEGQYGMGYMYQGGEGGVEQDMTEARKWYSQASQQGHKMAINTMADACIGPSASVLSKVYNKQKAEKMISDAVALCGPEPQFWIKRAADLDYVPAVQELAEAYRAGKYGLAVDPRMAADLDLRANKLLGIADKPKEKKKRRL